MPRPYLKKNPGDKSVSHWCGWLYLNGKRTSFPLGIQGPDGKRKAADRLDALARCIEDRKLSDQVRVWLTPGATKKLITAFRGPTSTKWSEILESYLQDTDRRDIKPKVDGKARHSNRTRIVRRSILTSQAQWMDANASEIDTLSYTEILERWIDYRRKNGIAPRTIWANTLPYGVLWGKWLYRKKITDSLPDVDLLKEGMPPKPSPRPVIPTWEEDVAYIKTCRDNRGEPYSSAWSRWCMVVIIRGLGCRVSEAMDLTWSTVDIEGGRVKFLETKEGAAVREVPILFEWVRAAMLDMRDKSGGTRPVCPNSEGRAWGHNVSRPKLTDKKAIGWKKLQKLAIDQLVYMGIPPYVVAAWTGHTLEVQEKHYQRDKNYLRPKPRDYGEFGALSDSGKYELEHWLPSNKTE